MKISRLTAVDCDFFKDFETDRSLSAFVPERPDREMDYRALRCPCGGESFRLTGWPRILSGKGGFFWRSVARVWRETRLPMQDGGEEVASPFWLPISTCCHGCDLEQTLLNDERVAGRMAPAERVGPKEFVRCRVCRRGLFKIVVGVSRGAVLGQHVQVGSDSNVNVNIEVNAINVEVLSHCRSCHLQARIAGSVDQRSEQEIQLDLLYGRR